MTSAVTGNVRVVARGLVVSAIFVSVHAPTKDRKLAETELVASLAQLTHRADAIVVHPDAAADLSAYRELGSTLVIENLDCRKEMGQTAEHLDRVFDVLPEAGLCFDIPQPQRHKRATGARPTRTYVVCLRRFGLNVDQLVPRNA